LSEEADALFILIGAQPRTEWLPDEIERDPRGFVETGPDFGTTLPGVFAIGDIRAGSVKRVASAVGEGSDSLTSIESVVGSDGDDTLTGDDGQNHFVPRAGDDVIDGGAGAYDFVDYFSATTSLIVDLTAGSATGGPGLVALEGAYHGLGYAPLAACGLRESYRAPFADQLNPRVAFAPYAGDEAATARSLDAVEEAGRTEGATCGY